MAGWWSVYLWGLVVLLAGCSGAPQPFSKATRPAGHTPPAITITALDGLPAGMTEKFMEFLIQTAGRRDIAIVSGNFKGGFSMAGRFQAMIRSGSTLVYYSWTLTDGNGRLVHSIHGSQTGGQAGTDPWRGVEADLLRIIADKTAVSLSNRLAQLGYATRAAGLPPPGQLELAGANAHEEIDYETLYGPGITAPPEAGRGPVTPPVAKSVKSDSKTTVNSRPVRHAQVNRTPDAQKRQPKSNRVISAVAMTHVSGSPGKGNRDLLVAMRKVMRKAGWPVLNRPRRDALSVSGRVKLSRPAGNRQKVELEWIVRLPNGKLLGTVRQSNMVKAGSLDEGWGAVATLASRAAAQGIFDLIKKMK